MVLSVLHLVQQWDIFAQDIDLYCWPMVRTVWQPVVEDINVSWGRAITTQMTKLFILFIRSIQEMSREWKFNSVRDEVQSRLEAGQVMSDMPESLIKEFLHNETRQHFGAQKRSIGIYSNILGGFEVRPELSQTKEMEDIVINQLFWEKQQIRTTWQNLLSLQKVEIRSYRYLGFLAFTAQMDVCSPKTSRLSIEKQETNSSI